MEENRFIGTISIRFLFRVRFNFHHYNPFNEKNMRQIRMFVREDGSSSSCVCGGGEARRGFQNRILIFRLLFRYLSKKPPTPSPVTSILNLPR